MLKKIELAVAFTILLGSLIIISTPSIASSSTPSGEALPLGASFYLAPGAAVSYEAIRGVALYSCKLTPTTVVKPIIQVKGEGAFKISRLGKSEDGNTYLISGIFTQPGKGWLTVADTEYSYGKASIVCDKA